jgi:hypothetical protein
MKPNSLNLISKILAVLCLLWTGVQPVYGEREVYVAPPYVPPPPPKSTVFLVDHGDGTLSTPKYNRMWAKKDSYADLGRCLNLYEAMDYVEKLTAGGYNDWRLPGLGELAMIYDNTKESVMGWDHNPEFPLALDERFADGAAYWYWSLDIDETKLDECCARTFYFVNGFPHVRRFTSCQNGGVRAVRNTK